MGWIRRSRKQAARALQDAVGEYELPHFPGAVLQALSALRDENSTLEQISETLNVDPGISVRVLSLVNSAGYGLRTPVDDLRQAVQLVGRAALESLLISMGVRRALPQATQGVDPRSFWKAAALRAAAARRLAELLCPREAQRAFTAALLQEMAVPMLAEQRGSAYVEILDRWRDGGPGLRELERDRFGCDHAELGLLMCQAWDLPESLAVAIGGHHDEPGDDDAIPNAVLLSGFLRESGAEAGADALVVAARDRHGLTPETVTGLLDASLEDAEDLARLLV